MLKYFKYSILVTFLGFTLAWFWGGNTVAGSGLKCLLIAGFLAILEITLSFDNAIINATRLKKMSDVWRRRFLLWGILIAVFGVRLFLPLVLVAFFSHHGISSVFDMALHDVSQYTNYLHDAHSPLVSFGGIFLLMIALEYFLDDKKEVHWIKGLEKLLSKLACVRAISIILALLTLCFVQSYVPEGAKLAVMLSGMGAIITFLLLNGLCEMLEDFASQKHLMDNVHQTGLLNFIYLEVIDASFSFDGLLGAFAISKDIIIICIGLAIGAMFVRSLTIFMVEKDMLKNYIYLEHGAHFAIGFLAVVMFVSIKTEVPEWVTGTVSLLIIGLSLISSIKEREDRN